MKIKIPATSANLGPGFDSCGIALNRYLEITVKEATTAWVIEHTLGADIATDQENLLIQTALQLMPELPPHRIVMQSTIPLARGLGSSSSVIVAGIELANQLGKLQLSAQEKLNLATAIEGHPDNVAPAILGQLAIASYEEDSEEVNVVNASFPECGIVAYIPKHELLTKTSRSVLPETFSYKEAVKASAVANVMLAALLTQDIALAAKMMAKDRFHESFRSQIIPELTELKEVARENGAYGAFLSGAGPTVLFLTPTDKQQRLMDSLYAYGKDRVTVEALSIDRQGIQVID